MPIVRHLFRALCASLLLSGPALAGEVSELRPIGFSADGKVFAFEEFGVQDGSGFPFANRFYIDTTSDTFLPGSPVEVILKDEQKHVGDARAAAKAQAAAFDTAYAFDANPGVIAAFNPLTELGADAGRLSYASVTLGPQPFGTYELALEEKQLPTQRPCRSMNGSAAGFHLAFTRVNGKPAGITLHDDTVIPESRGCPLGYRIGGVVTHMSPGAITHAVLVLVFSPGFEGESARWTAVTRRLE
ncbi:hypothetical protein AWJ14_00370 [Hoeflea olei]|uniref:DUF2259 domain-containing protein n=2 Tax=Hoeflea olei TaxID=1480615 RepID=A0A1C1YYY7_9HYPH|nr:hypothetical protein AWJ14_00370 [Hoeflea olei]